MQAMSQLTPELLQESIASGPMDSVFENSLATYVRTLDPDAKLALLTSVLLAPRPACRALGLRVVRRTVTERAVLDNLLTQCFSLKRYSEIEMWYGAILARYPLLRLAHRLRSEIEARADPDFELLHVRALQMYRSSSPRLKQAALRHLEGQSRQHDAT